MNDTQILTLSITLLGIFAASWFNNSRIGDVNGRIGDVNTRIAAIKDVIRAEMRLEFERVNSKIDSLLKLVADIDQRVTALEARR